MKKSIIIICIALLLGSCSVYKSTPESAKMERSEYYALQQKEAMHPYQKK
jgi:PBP1b-binding outer membrane lipoprotein LpoB